MGRQLLVVKSVNQLFIDQHVLPAGFVLQVLHSGNQFVVGGQKRQFGVPMTGNQRFADKHFACAHRINAAKVNAPAVVDHQPVQRGPL